MRVLGRPDGPEPHNGLLYCYEDTNITEEKAVKDAKTQLNDALIESYAWQSACLSVSVSFGYLRSSLVKPQSSFSLIAIDCPP